MGCEETIDELKDFGLRIIQPRHGYRFSLDPLLLCEFCAVSQGERVVDLGTGCGVIPLVLSRSGNDVRVVGVESQPTMAALAHRNVVLNQLTEEIEIIETDILLLRDNFSVSSFDLVVSNPPYRRRGTGRISPVAGRENARHESTANLGEFLAASKYLVKPGGRICFIHHPSRLAELLTEADKLRLAPLRLRMVHGNACAEARIFMVELVKGRTGELKVLPPLMVHGKEEEQD